MDPPILLALVIVICLIFVYLLMHLCSPSSSEKFEVKMSEKKLNVTDNSTVPVSQTIVHEPRLVRNFNINRYYAWALLNTNLCYKPIWLRVNTVGGKWGNDIFEYPGRLIPGKYKLIIYEQRYPLNLDRFSTLLCWDRSTVEQKNGLIPMDEIQFKVEQSTVPDDLVPLTRKFSRDFHDTCIGTGENKCHEVANSVKLGCVKKLPGLTAKPLLRAYAPGAQKTCINVANEVNNVPVDVKWSSPPCWDATSKDWEVTGYIEKEKSRPDLVPLYNAYHKVADIGGPWEGLEMDCGVTPDHPYCDDVPSVRWNKLGYIYPSNLC